MIAGNCGDLIICTLLKGHISPVATDASYIKQNHDDIKETYMAALEDLSLKKIEAKVYTSEIRKEMESKIRELEDKNKKMEDEYPIYIKSLTKRKSVKNCIVTILSDLCNQEFHF